MNQDLSKLEISTLVDILARATERYTELLSKKDFGTEYEECKKTIRLIQQEIGSRKETKNPDASAGVSENS